MSKKKLINKDIEVFYNKASEETRLNNGMGVFEFERIKTLIEKYIPSSTSKIIDVGGGTGKYSEWLAKKGHKVHLIEPVEKHVKLAQNRADKIATFLLLKGIKPERFSAIGYGEDKLLNQCSDGIRCTEEEHLQNMRVEMKLTKINRLHADYLLGQR